MNDLPVTQMTLYKHGVGFFERRGERQGEALTLTFREDEMNDILKSLTVIDWGEGQVLGVDYPTPQSREQLLAGNTIRLEDQRSLRDLLSGLRGRRVRLYLDQAETLTGRLLGWDEPGLEQPLTSALVSILLEDEAEATRVETVRLERLQGVSILDDQAASDLRFFLKTAMGQEDYRQVTVRLSPGAHDLAVSYVAPAPTWRVSYRLVADSHEEKVLLLGWGIFDNRLEEDLEKIQLSLVAGMPISFVYDLYTPFTPERPVVAEEERVAPGPVMFGASMRDEVAESGALPDDMRRVRSMAAAAPAAAPAQKAALQSTTMVSASGQSRGELFQYDIGTPVSVGRGQSAMVPIVSAELPYRKELLYNRRKLPSHPVATVRMNNTTGLTLERGPVTVAEDGAYVGEAILPFTAEDGELIVPYAVELNVRIHEEASSERTIHGLHVTGAYLVIEEWEIQRYDYILYNQSNRSVTVLIEHPRQAQYQLFDSPEPVEQSEDALRFRVEVAEHERTTVRVQMRRLLSRREQVERQSFDQLQRYLQQGLLRPEVHQQLVGLRRLWEQIANLQRQIEQIGSEREKIYQSQGQIQGNMQALGTTGKEGALRSRYVEQLEATEEQLRQQRQEEKRLQEQVVQLREEVDRLLQELD